MCVRFSPLTAEEAQAVLDARGRPGTHAIRFIEHPDPIHDARSGSHVPVYVPDAAGDLAVAQLEWGFPLDGKPNVVFNTRIGSALEQLRSGRRGMWTKATVKGRCLVPVRVFYESHATEKGISEKSGKPIRHQYRFRLPGAHAVLLAVVQQDGRFSTVTKRRPNPRPHAARPRDRRA